MGRWDWFQVEDRGSGRTMGGNSDSGGPWDGDGAGGENGGSEGATGEAGEVEGVEGVDGVGAVRADEKGGSG